MRITNIELTDINNNSETIYDVKIIIDNCLCLSGIKINLYTDELVVSYPDTIAPVDNKIKNKLDNAILSKATIIRKNRQLVNQTSFNYLKSLLKCEFSRGKQLSQYQFTHSILDEFHKLSHNPLSQFREYN